MARLAKIGGADAAALERFHAANAAMYSLDEAHLTALRAPAARILGVGVLRGR